MKIAILGAGSFGTALAKVLSEKVDEVALWSHSADVVDSINKTRINSVYLSGIELPDNISTSMDMELVFKNADIVLSVLPTQVTREVWLNAKRFLSNQLVVVGSKGIERGTKKLVNEIFLDVIGEDRKDNLFFLSGPSFARELAEKKPTAITIAGVNEKKIKALQEIFYTKYFRVYGTTDVVGVELGGAMKNIIALATGISDGLGMGNNSRAALITRGLAEIARLGKEKGADPITFMGLAGLGDLVLTCTGDLSRNREVGLKLGKGYPIKTIMEGTRMVAEGVFSTESAYELSQDLGVEMPITTAAYEIIYNNKSPGDVYGMLMHREQKFESE